MNTLGSSSDLITPLLLTFNEAPNIGRSLERLQWAKSILVVDSFSSDETLQIVQRFPQVRVLQRAFDSFAGQCNFGLTHIKTPWVLSMDADYILPAELVREIETLDFTGDTCGYAARFIYCVYGKPLRGTLYPPRTVLYRRDKARYCDDGHGHRVHIKGTVGLLNAPLLHDDRKDLGRWLRSQDRYMILEAHKLMTAPRRSLSRADRLRRTKVLAPFVVLMYCLFAKGVVLDGWPGWYYTLQRVLAEMILALRLVEAENLHTEQQPPISPQDA